MFSQATMIVDGTDCPCELKERTYGELSGQYRSYKLGAAALRTQVAILANRIICFVSHSVPASMHDKRHLDESGLLELLAHLEKILADLGYVGVRQAILGFKRPAGGIISHLVTTTELISVINQICISNFR